MVNVVSFFAGCGGSSLGYKLAGANVILASDFEKAAMQIYAHNFPKTVVLCKNIRNITGQEITELSGLQKGEIDILDGSPPCTAFSMSGIREKGWGKEYKHTVETTVQRSDDLFFEFIRMIDELRPKAFIAENVKGLIIGNAKGYFKRILTAMKGLNYDVNAYLLNCANYGVPQARERVVFIGFRKDIKQDNKVKLIKKKQISFLQAVAGLKIPPEELKRARDSFQYSSRYSVLRLTKSGYSASSVHPLGQCFNYRRPRLDKPIPTIIAHSNIIMHPTENRWMTTSELKRCASFPDNFWFPTTGQANIRIGNCVPPNLMRSVAEYVIKKGRFTR